MSEIRTKRLCLRAPRPEDEADLFAVFSDPRAMRHWSKPPFTDPAQVRDYIEGALRADPAESAEFVIEREGRVIGKAGFWRMPEVGFILHPDHWGAGIATEAVSALLAHGFDRLGLRRVTADVDPDNAASIALLGKLGFVETGREKATLEIAGVWYDSVYLALDRPDAKGPPARG